MKKVNTIKNKTYILKWILSALGFLFVVTSCSTTSYLASLKPESTDIIQDAQGAFLIRTDSVWVTYNFNGEKAPISITVHNRTDYPIRVDWVESGIIMNNSLINYAGDNFDAEKIRPSMTVPPKSSRKKTPMILNANPASIKNKHYTNSTYTLEGKTHKKGEANFALEDSPLYFRCYLAIYTHRGDLWEFEDGFYLQKIQRFKNIMTDDLPEKETEKGNTFYVEKAGGKKAFNGFVKGMNVTRLILLDILSSPEENAGYYEYQNYNNGY